MIIRSISSVAHAEVKQVVALSRSKKERITQNLFVAEGLRTCSTLIESKIRLSMLYVTDEHLQDAKKIAPLDRITCVRIIVMEKMSSNTTPSGILGVFEIPKSVPLSQLSHGIVLAQVADPGNMGTLIRSAAAMNVPCVVIIDGTDPYSPKAVQASAGTIGCTTVFMCDWQSLIRAAHSKKISLCALVVANGASPSTINFKNSLIIVGSEAHGIPTEWLDSCDQSITLAMPGNTESLNAAVAGSIALYVGYAQ